MSLVQVSKRDHTQPPVPSAIAKMLSFVLIDKFFLLGAAAGLFGSIGLGSYLWLIRSGLVEVDTSVFAVRSLRELHAMMQFYLFFTPFILGFLLQSSAKLFESRIPLPRAVRLALPGTVTAAIALILWPASPLAPVIISACIWGVALAMVPHLIAAPWPIRLRFGLFAILGLLSLGIGPFTKIELPTTSLLVFWMGIVPIIFATAQQFIAGVLEGRRPTAKESLLTLLLLIVTGITLGQRDEGALQSSLSAVLALLTFLVFIYSTNATIALRRLNNSFGAAFVFAHIWACVGALLLAAGPLQADSVLHLWGIGYAVTLIIAVSMRLIAWITEVKLLSENSTIALLTAWQIVPALRGFQTVVPYSPTLVWIGVGVGALVLAIWAGTIAISVFSMLRSQYRALCGAQARHHQTQATMS